MCGGLVGLERCVGGSEVGFEIVWESCGRVMWVEICR